MSRRLLLIGLVALIAGAMSAPANAAKPAPLKVQWTKGFTAPGTPAKYNKVGILKIGKAKAKNVMVFVPGTSGGSAYIVPFAQWLTSRMPDWQVWSVERRENLLEDQSVVDQAKAHTANNVTVFNYYLGFISNPGVTRHLTLIPNADVDYAHQWGMNVAIGDLRKVVLAARALGGHVVLSGHSLGGTVVTAYATWDFHGKSGATDLDGLVYDDGASGPTTLTADTARTNLTNFAKATPWLAFSGVPAPFLGLFSALGATGAIYSPDSPSLGQQSPLLPASLKPSVPVTELAQFGFAVDTKTSTLTFAAQAHVGQLDLSKTPAGWDNSGAITPLTRYAAMLAGKGVQGADGSEWYFPQRLTIDSAAVNQGIDNDAQHVYGEHATHGKDLPKRLLMYAFGAAGGQRILDATTLLATNSGIPASHLTLIQHQDTYAHNDPASAYPKNLFFDGMVPFLKKVGKQKPLPAARR